MLGGKILDKIIIELKDPNGDSRLPLTIEVQDTSLGRKWLQALNHLLENQYHLEKNYCFFGFLEYGRDGPYILDQINASIKAINDANIGYHIDDHFSMDNVLTDQQPPNMPYRKVGRNLVHEKLNWLHRYFEDLQGVSGNISPFYISATDETKWHIRQLNLLCHEFESWALSYRKILEAPDWQRPSQLMCWLNAPRFVLDEEDHELFGVDTISRSLGGVYVGVNKAVGKHHWEIFNDEGRDSRIDELVSTSLRSQTEAAGDFDIEWGQDPTGFDWQERRLNEFREWLTANGFDPEDKTLTIGHPKVAQVDLEGSFGSKKHSEIWAQLNKHLDVIKVSTSDASAVYEYSWNDPDYMQRQIEIISRGKTA